MPRPFLGITMVAVTLASVECPLAAENESTADSNLSFMAARVLATTDIVLENHIDPPTRQQMVLAESRDCTVLISGRPRAA